MKKKQNSIMPFIFLLFFIIGCMILVNLGGKEVHELAASEFITNLDEGKISEIEIITKVRSENYQITGKLKDYKDNESFILYLPVSVPVQQSRIRPDGRCSLPDRLHHPFQPCYQGTSKEGD